MTESKGPDNQDGTAVPGKKKRGGRLRRLRPYAFAVVSVAVVFGVSAVIGAHVRAGKDDKVSEPANAVGPAAVPTGPADTASPTPSAAGPKLDMPVHPSVPVTVTIYEDLRSPVSKAFADTYGPVLTQLLTTGQMQIHYRLVTSSDRKYGGTGSLEAANAAACAQDQGRFTQFVDQVFKNQPDPQTDSLAKESVLKELALKAHKIQMGKFEPCLEQHDHLGWAKKSQTDYAASGLGALPVVQVNHTTIKDVESSLTPQKLHRLVLAEAKRVIALQDTPSATPTTTG
ncbi:DsbA family protein [Actinacidiphila sp. ITFR-21]|uniref:DsbA family protein n=1 Tax=Actinacidiphila sp. ITFR-21 TaxID=3075199 RepID=UPI00288933E4|nr:thioredoxin domain-containing protein [Streptomyces sp. ITFR-21]WNI18486.1 thioredoxin domain-containing protein [Streptomyces sp. ITFR-21]